MSARSAIGPCLSRTRPATPTPSRARTTSPPTTPTSNWKKSCTPAFSISWNHSMRSAAGGCRYDRLFSESKPRRRLLRPPPVPAFRPFPRSNPGPSLAPSGTPPGIVSQNKKTIQQPLPPSQAANPRCNWVRESGHPWCAHSSTRTF